MRNPRRTAATSLALTIGVAIVAMYTVFAATAKVAIADTVAEGFSGDLVIQSTNFSGAGLSPDLAVELDALPEVDAVGYGFGPLLLDGVQETPMIGDPAALGAMIDVEEREGSLAGLRDDQLAVSDERAAAEGWTLGTPVPVAFADGTATTFTIGAVYEEHELVDDVILPVAAWTPHATNHFDTIVFLRAAEGVEVAEARAAATEVTRRYHAPEPQTEDEYVDTQNAFLDQTLTVVYVLLALSGFIALMGIANTLSLAVHERTSELGLLRAVGQTRRQLRSMVRRESVLLALHGTIVGLALGVGVGWAFLRAAADSEGITAPFTVPVTGLAVILLIGGIVGVLAGERPARRAAKLDVLEAIASE